MRHVLAFLLPALLAGCSTAPYTPSPQIKLPSIAPVEGVASKVKLGNRAIIDSSRSLQGKLDDTRSRLDAAIVESHQAKLDAGRLDTSLAAASASLDAALAESHTLVARAADQDATIDDLQKQVGSLKADQANAQTQTNDQTAELNTNKQENAQFKAQEKEDKGNWGLNGVWRWFKYMGWHVIILIVIIAAATMAIRLFAPAALPIFTRIWKGVLWAVRGLWSILSRLWRPKGGSP